MKTQKSPAAVTLKTAQLIVSGAIIGLYAAKAFGFVGFDVGPHLETAGAGVGAVAAVLAVCAKAMHFV